ncbi:ATP-binding protein [Deinococcus sp. 23YEL01]|uniref:sensor histidine kinase n=1 Tax=Deinococcus sp. 23YEL01 TaxID=2745871 RepID=UPI001E6501E7|nr:ATP-binding protein [Deinococcus sp. 23YEL01]MCD0169702.1 CHASE3 domain-containing protein [Deinococcus sp. 23YEL01]
MAAPASRPPDLAPATAPRRRAGRPSLRSFLLRPFLLPFTLLLGVGVAVTVGVHRNEDQLRLVSDAQTRMLLLNDLNTQLSVMENGERGYVITGDPDFLAPYREGDAAFRAAVFALHDLSVTDLQRTNLARVQSLVLRWQEDAARPEIAARSDSLAQAASLVQQGKGRDLLNDARDIMSVMRTNESGRLSAATTASQSTLATVRTLTVGGLLLSLALLLLTAYRVTRTVTHSLNDLNAGATDIAAGQYQRRMPVMPVRELAQLGEQFDVMAAAVQEREQALRESAEALRASNTHLERSNRELEQFAYVASHDLQEPLRTIGSYTELLARRYQGQLDERADQYIAFTTSATQRMKTLIQDLLAYSRVRNAPRATQPVDTAALVRDITADLEQQILSAQAQVTAHGLPVILSNPELMRHVLQNLIGNALKFRDPTRPALVQVSAERTRHAGQDRWVFHVQDNGIGIAPEYHERIFGVFQRLHGMDEYPGSGIGLAVTRSAAEQLGGQLWLDSEPGQGSTFHLALPVVTTPDLPEPTPPQEKHA